MKIKKAKTEAFAKATYENLELSECVRLLDDLRARHMAKPRYADEIAALEARIQKEENADSITPWEKVLLSRHPERPHTVDYITHITEEFIELSGDRLYADDAAIIGGFATIQKTKVVLIGQEKGSDTESRLKRNFGMVNPEGFRKALRLMQLAEKFSLPVVTLVDTPGAYAGLEAEERGQGWAIAKNLYEMARLRTPLVSIVIGEGCSGGALGIACSDVVAALENSYYSVISPEGCASILWRDVAKKEEAANALKLTPKDLLSLGIIDAILPEPKGGAHLDTQVVYTTVSAYITKELSRLSEFPLDTLLEKRYQKFRVMGSFSS